MRERKPTPRGAYKLIAVDLDGTLLDSTGKPHAIDVAALREARARGVHVTIITGRLYTGSKESVIAIGADGPVACADGSHIVNGATHTTVVHHGLEGDGAEALRRALSESTARSFVFARDTIFHDERGKILVPYVRIWSDDIQETKLFERDLWHRAEGLTAVVAIGTEAEIKRIIAVVEPHASVQINHFPIRRVGEDTWGMIVRRQGGTKGSALSFIATHHGLHIDECVVVGDWHNDIPMLSVAGRAFVMGQAPDAVKDVGTDLLVETAQTGGGIARAIAEAFGFGA